MPVLYKMLRTYYKLVSLQTCAAEFNREKWVSEVQQLKKIINFMEQNATWEADMPSVIKAYTPFQRIKLL
jgi:ferritin